MALERFELEKAAFEVRFKFAVLLWDRVGHLWHRMLKDYPDLKSVEAEPGKTIFTLRRDYQLTLTLERLNLVAFGPVKSADMASLTNSFVSAARDILEIAEYDRIGFRMTFFRKLATRRDAVIAASEFKQFRPPNGRFFGADEITNLSSIVRWEGKDFGAQMQVNAEGRKIEFEPPVGLRKIEGFTEDLHGLTVDVDYFSSHGLPVGQFDAIEWIRQAEHIIRRDGDAVLSSVA
jgi:hypothetical protein